MTLAPERDRGPADTAAAPLAGCPRRRPPSADRPRLADGVELLGEYAGSGYTEPQQLARRPGGQLVQLSPLLHLVAEACDGRRDLAEIARLTSEGFGRTVSEDNVRTLVDTKLRPLGVLAAADGTSPPVQTSDPLLGLKLRRQLLPPRVVQVLARAGRPLFPTPVVVAVVAALLAVDVWLFAVHGLAQGLRSSLQQPAIFLVVIATVVVAAALHELGHAAACAYGGARPGGMGAGLYVVWPAFYTDVTEAYRLDRRGRLRTDLGGVYVNAIVVLAVVATFAATAWEPLILLAFLLQVQVLQQMLPLLRLDGYYVLSDLVGVPDLFRRIGPVLRSAVPGRGREREVEELKPWVRRVVVAWVFVLVPVLLLNVGYLLLSAPRMVATGWESAAGLLAALGPADALGRTWVAVQLLLLAAPFAGVTYTMSRVARRGAGRAWAWSAGSAARRAGVLGGGLALAGLLALAWWPDGRLTPYREGERGTVQQSVRELRAVGQGQPLLRSPAQAREPLPAVAEGGSAVLDAEPVAATTGPAVTEPAPAGPVASPTPTPSPRVTPMPTASPRATPSPSPSAGAGARRSPAPAGGDGGADDGEAGDGEGSGQRTASPTPSPTASPSPASGSASPTPRATPTPRPSADG